MPLDPLSVYAKSEQVIAREIEDEFVLVPISPGSNWMENGLYILNETGRELWELLNGKINLNHLIEIMNQKYNSVTKEQIQYDIVALIEDLLNHNMIKKVV